MHKKRSLVFFISLFVFVSLFLVFSFVFIFNKSNQSSISQILTFPKSFFLSSSKSDRISHTNLHPAYSIQLNPLYNKAELTERFEDVLEKENTKKINIITTDQEQETKFGWVDEQKKYVIHESFSIGPKNDTLEIVVHLNSEAFENVNWPVGQIAAEAEIMVYKSLLSSRSIDNPLELDLATKDLFNSLNQREWTPLFLLTKK